VLTVKLAAARIGVSPGLIYDWVGSGVLPHFRVGRVGRRGGIRLAAADPDAFLLTLKQGRGPKVTTPPALPPVKLKHLRLKPS
jgi:excisionase family DNA binding protein